MTNTWPNDSDVLTLTAPLIKRFEKLELEPYLCPAGKWTIGYGTTKYPSGIKVARCDPQIDATTANNYLQSSMLRVLRDMQKNGAIIRVPTISQAAAILSLAYNCGLGCHDGKKGDLADSDLLSKFNLGNVSGAADEFLEWDKAHVWNTGHTAKIIVVLAGLKSRRKVERDLFLKE
jgi:lysozyme